MPKQTPVQMTADQYFALAESRFGKDTNDWKFICPSCGTVISVADYKNAGAPQGAIGFSCIGRYLPKCNEAFGGPGSGPCNYTNGGLFNIAPVIISNDGKQTPFFALAELVTA